MSKVRKGTKLYPYNGGMYSARELAEMTGGRICVTTMRYRLQSGWSVSKALDKNPMKPQESGSLGASVANSERVKHYVVDGVKVDVPSLVSEASGISRQTMHWRLQAGWSRERAISEPVNNRKGGES